MSNESSFENTRANKLDPRFWQRLSACPLCGAGSFCVVAMAKDRHYQNLGSFAVVECELCKLWFLNPMPTLEYLSGAYPMDYYSYTTQPPNSASEPRMKPIKNLVRRLIGFRSGKTHDPSFLRPGNMLDIGCGAGTFLLEMRDRGWNVHGVELSVQAAERGRQQGLDIFGGTLESAHFPSSTFDYVRSNHSFEHIHNPREVLREVRRIIKPNGMLFIGVPNVRCLMSRLYGTYWWYLGAPVHPFGYIPATLERLLTEEGFRVKKVGYNSSCAGFSGSLQIFLNRKNGKTSEDGWIIRNRLIRLLAHWIARWVDFFHVGDCIEVIAQPVAETKPPSAVSSSRRLQ